MVAAFLLICCLPTAYVQAQAKQDLEDYLEVADELFAQENFDEAKLYYEKAAKHYQYDGYSAFKLAECYNKLYDYPKASEWYGKAYDREGAKFPQALLMKASILKMDGKYEEAKKTLERFEVDYKPEKPEDTMLVRRAIIEDEGVQMALEKPPAAQLTDYEFKPLSNVINSKYPEFAAVIYDADSTIVVTSHNPASQGRNIDPRLGMPFSDNMRYELKGGTWREMKKNDNFNVINTIINDGAGVFNKDRTKYYYTSCFEGNGECMIYVSSLVKGKWQKPVKLNTNINKPNCENKHPALSATGDTLFFVSTREGGLGMNDIWYSTSTGGNDTWTAPVNMGDKVNTPFEEMSPFYFSDKNALFFSSRGFKGLGGLDIYMYAMDGTNKLINLGKPFNSPRDDFYFVMGGKYGYMSSNRTGDGSNYDIYTFRTDNKRELLASLEQEGLTDVVVTASASKKRYSDDDLALQSSQAFQQLTPEQQSQILRFMAAKVAATNYAGDAAGLEEKDKFFYEKLPAEEKARLDRYGLYKVVQSYYAADPDLKAKDEEYLTSLPLEDQARLERLIMSQIAKLLEEKDQPLKAKDRLFLEKQSIEAKNAIDRMTRYRNFRNIYIHDPSLQAEDEAFYKNLPADVRNAVDRMAKSRNGDKIYALTPALKEQDDRFYSNLTLEERNKIDRIIAFKLMEEAYAKDPTLKLKDKLYYDKLSPEERASVDRIIAARISNVQYQKDVNLREKEKDYYTKLPQSEKNRIERMAAMRLMTLVYDDGTINLLNADLLHYQELPTEQRLAVERWAAARAGKYFYGDNDALLKEDELVYQNLPPNIRELVDKLIESRLAGKYKNEDTKIKAKDRVTYRKMAPEERDQVARIVDAMAKRNAHDDDLKLKEKDNFYYQNLDAEAKEELERSVANRLANMRAADDLQLKEKNDFNYRGLSAEEKARIDRIIEARLGHGVYGNDELLKKEDDLYYKNLPYSSKTAINKMIAHRRSGKKTVVDDLALSEKDKFYYQQLEAEDRKRIDRIIESLLGHNVYSRDPALKEEDEQFYKNLSPEQKASIDAIVAARRKATAKKGEDLTAGLLEKDKNYYYSLSPEEKERLNRMVQERLGKDVYEGDKAHFKKGDDLYYKNLTPEAKAAMDNIINTRTATKLVLSDGELRAGHYHGEPAMMGRVFFDANQTNIRVDGYKFLDHLATHLKQHPEKRLYILAHSDSFGNDDYNLELSKKRAKNAKEYLTKRGVKTTIVMPEGKGEAFPLMPNTTAYGRKMNRRAEFYVVDK
ncbi:OmpA family protein [Flexibacter flexilis]|uniref:OmpA family protein n=1 Tax=Flexibacter flexilis TaxID=998 RepID=UPI001160338D|nr:OmpA family protein [Flexibacter flexilis]